MKHLRRFWILPCFQYCTDLLPPLSLLLPCLTKCYSAVSAAATVIILICSKQKFPKVLSLPSKNHGRINAKSLEQKKFGCASTVVKQMQKINPEYFKMDDITSQLAYSVTVAPLAAVRFDTLWLLLYTFAPVAEVAQPLKAEVAVAVVFAAPLPL